MALTNLETIERRRKRDGLRELTTEEKVRIYKTGVYIPPEKLNVFKQVYLDELITADIGNPTSTLTKEQKQKLLKKVQDVNP